MKKVTIKGKEIKLVKDAEFTIGIGVVLNKLLLALDESEIEWDAKKLKEGDCYWYLNSAGDLISMKWEINNIHAFRLRSNNVYPTEEAAQKAYDEIMNKEI